MASELRVTVQVLTARAGPGTRAARKPVGPMVLVVNLHPMVNAHRSALSLRTEPMRSKLLTAAAGQVALSHVPSAAGGAEIGS